MELILSDLNCAVLRCLQSETNDAMQGEAMRCKAKTVENHEEGKATPVVAIQVRSGQVRSGCVESSRLDANS